MKTPGSSLLMTKDEILSYFKDRELDQDSKAYLKYHSIRYQQLLKEIEKIISSKKAVKLRILDLGPAYQTELLRRSFPNIAVDSLGFYDPRFPLRKIDKHFEYDLNNAQDKGKWLKTSPYNLVIMAELIEHLYTSPKLVLGFIHSLMLKKGILIIQTPNAVSLDRRIKMVFGKHPFDMIRENNLNPGHFREYTVSELTDIAKENGFKVKKIILGNYFVHKQLIGKLYDLVCLVLPSGFKHGITLILEK